MWLIIGLCLVGFVFWRFINEIGSSIPLLELMLFVAGLQWIVGPFIEYKYPSHHYKYYMYVSEDVYMSFVVPAYTIFVLTILFLVNKSNNIKIPITSLTNYSQYGVYIFGIGVVFDIIGGFLPGGLAFFAFLLSNFKFAGAIILYFSEDKMLKKVFYGALGYLLVMALAKALFHDLILWGVFFFMFWAIEFKPSKRFVLLIFCGAVFFLSTLQTIKMAYRSKIWNGYSGNKMELFMNLMVESVTSGGNKEKEIQDESQVNIRLNQGWIISAILYNVPYNTFFAQGETVKEAIFASLLPRFLNPNKKEAGGQENFIRFTGLELAKGTSMGISVIGEAYGNYGVNGGIIFMGAWGLFLAYVWKRILKVVYKNIVFIAFLPLIFLQVIKAETELVVVLNHLVKASMVVFAFFWFMKNVTGWRFNYEKSN